MRPIWIAVTVTLLALTGAVTADTDSEPASHPEVDIATATCDGCHGKITADVVDDWYASPHGTNNVKCFVCHGSTGADFMPAPTAERCLACHADAVASMDADHMQDKRCSSCHPSHRLNPHAQVEEGGNS
jgi:hypothetical protein